MTSLYTSDEAVPLVEYALKNCELLHTLSEWHYAAKELTNGSTGLESSRWNTGKQNKGQKSRQNAYPAHARGHLLIFHLRLSFRVGLTDCTNFPLQTSSFPSLPSQMPRVEPDWQCSGGRLSAQIDFFAPWGVDMLHLTGRWLCTVCLLVKSDTDKKRLGENWHTEENPRPEQIFDDVIFAGLGMEVDVDICVTSAQSDRQSLSLSLVLSLHSLCLSILLSMFSQYNTVERNLNVFIIL